MGQDTRCIVGVTYHCQYIPENREIIEKLIQMKDVSAFIKADEDTDEMLEITDTINSSKSCGEMFNSEYLAKTANDWYGHEDITIIGEEVIFKVTVYEAHVRNMSRRGTYNSMFNECSTAVGMITTLQKIVNELKTFGIDENDLAIGHTFTDD